METITEKTYSTNTRTKRVALYLRVSTDEQAKEGHYGLKVQEDSLRKYCEFKNYSLNEEYVFIDAGLSGSLPINKRPALNEAMERAERNEFDVLLVYKLDRLFRDLHELLGAEKMLVKYKIELESPSDHIDTSTPMGRFGFQMIGGFAELEKGVIRQRMMGGKLRAAQDGKWVTGVPPYGYRVDKKTKTLVLEPTEVEVVKKFYEWLVFEKCSLREITQRAIELNLPTPAHKSIRGQKSSKSDIRIKGNWYRRTINRILVNEVYTGTFYYNKYKRPFKYLSAIDNEEHQRPKNDHIELQVPPVISREMFEKAIEQLKMNRVMQKRNEKRTYLFSGLLYSGYTGHKLQSGYQTPKKDLKTPTLGKYYHVYIPPLDRSRDDGLQYVNHGQCAETRLITIWDTLVSILKDPANTIPQLEEYTFKNSNEAQTVKKIAELDKQLVTINEQQVRIVRAYTDLGIEQDEYESMIKEKRSRQKELEIQKQKLSQTLLKKQEQHNRNEVITQLFEKLKSKLDTVTYEQQQYILRLFVERITLKHKENFAEVVFKFPINTAVSTIAPSDITTDGQMRLVVHVKVLSEKQRSAELLRGNPGMYKKSKSATKA
jgi:site-specific DNA recombinase